jgi:hypothetical protein
MREWRQETIACQDVTEARLECKKPTSVNMESEVDHQEVPTEEAKVKSLGTMMKWRRGWHLAAGRHGEPKELT